MNRSEQAQHVSNKIMEATTVCKTWEDFSEMLLAIGYTIGSLTCELGKDDREHMVMKICEMVGKGFMDTTKRLGETSDLEITVGNRGGVQ